ncbi:hypothetical protein GCM10010990_17110 [Croceicoccus mobilis]|uniref:Peptidase S8/S53 domain-containing protein n=2 Tax=Croceicoccus mobilis TaxID=1703339 RepID=A0A917DUK0_9SPHN|nr:hypothetical protein GCM10010990_17110 [Croceicoccus mobilis]
MGTDMNSTLGGSVGDWAHRRPGHAQRRLLRHAFFARCAIAAIGASALAACGGGGSGGTVVSTPAPAPAPSPSPTPTPAPTPTIIPAAEFDTAEYRDSDGPDLHNAIAAWQEGATGEGVAIAIIDTGIDSDNPEFAGRISTASADVAGSRSIESIDGHGTQVALVAAAARNGEGVMGIAYDATIIAYRTDTPGTCDGYDPANPDTGCSFDDHDIATGVNLAVANGARVINISLGGSLPTQELSNALAAAAQAGAVIVVSAGNDGESTDLTLDPSNPDPFAIGAFQAAAGNLIIAGSVDENAVISGFSNKAGDYGSAFLAAQGEDVCCVYEDGEIYTETIGGTDYVYVVNGTSFAAPQISGAAALLAQAFPNLTGTEIVELLLTTAVDKGASGTDEVYGSGVLDIAAAFAPQGTTSLAGSTTVLSLASATGSVSPAMGDAGAQGALGAIVLDGYDRAYTLNLATSLRAAARRRDFAHGLMASSHARHVETGPIAMSFSVADTDAGMGAGTGSPMNLSEADADSARVLAARITARLSPETAIAFGFRQGSAGLEAGLQGREGAAFMVASEAGSDMGFAAMRDGSMALRQDMGGWGLTVSGESGRVWTPLFDQDLLGVSPREDYLSRFGVTADMKRGSFSGRLGISWLSEDGTMLGARFAEALAGDGGADSLFLDASAAWRPAAGWRIGASWRQGFTRAARGGLVASESMMASNAWSVDAVRGNVLTPGDRLAFRVSQPLRVSGGGLTMNLPVSYDYASESAGFARRTLSLSPSGREIASEVSWQGPLWGGSMAASLFHRREPGHVASLPDDYGAGLRWGMNF